MGREFPQGENIAAEIHPFIAMSLFIASIAATIATVSSLCGSLSRKRSPSHSSSSSAVDPEQNSENREDSSPENAAPTLGEESLQDKPLPPPPGQRLTAAASYHFRSSSSVTSSSLSSQLKKLPASMSMRALGNGFGMGIGLRQPSKRNHDTENDHSHKSSHKDHKKFKHEDSIWKKTIILGEKCKVPDEDDEDSILYDEKGKRIATYHRKATSLAPSRQNSISDQDAIPITIDQGQQKDEVLRNALVGNS